MGIPTCGLELIKVEMAIRWDRQVVEKIGDCLDNSSVACSFRSVVDNVLWAFAGVYGPNDDFERRYFWE